uniref:Uncharacterized protein n=1 Tax=Oryza punctata TaxID=4537 RepID=A0A0E0MHZ7_ORYPU
MRWELKATAISFPGISPLAVVACRRKMATLDGPVSARWLHVEGDLLVVAAESDGHSLTWEGRKALGEGLAFELAKATPTGAAFSLRRRGTAALLDVASSLEASFRIDTYVAD